MLSRRKRTFDELITLPFCLQFVKNRNKLGDCFYYAIREESLAQLCLIEGAIQTHEITIIRNDVLNALWLLFSSIHKKSFIVSDEEIKLYSKFFDILLQNDCNHLYNIRDGIREAVWFLDDEILRRRLIQTINKCVLPLLSFSSCHNFIISLQKEQDLLKKVNRLVDIEVDSFDGIIDLFQLKKTIDYIYLLEKKLSYVCPSIVIMFRQLHF